MLSLRRATRDDGPMLWALNDFPNVGGTADRSVPLALTPNLTPPAAFPDLADVEEYFTAIGDEFVVAELDDHLVGMGGFHRTGPDTAEIVRIRTHPACRRQGVGVALMGELERRAAEHGIVHLDLNTAHNMPEALAFYDAIGYRRTRTESNPEWSWTLQHFGKDLAAKR